MNIKIAIRLQNNQLQDIDNKYLVFDKSNSYYSTNLLLIPLYALPSDISDLFLDEPGIYENKLYQLIFEGSLEIDSYLSPALITSLGLTPEVVFYIKRHYVICYTTARFSKIFYKDYLKSVKKSKFLADVKVSLEIEREPELINNIQSDAKDCMAGLLAGLGSSFNMQSFVKGECNEANKTSYRQWYPSLGNGKPDISMATAKTLFKGNLYKIGDQGSWGNKY